MLNLNHIEDHALIVDDQHAHDMRNLLAGINLSVALLRRYGRVDDERGHELLARIQDSSARMATLINELPDAAHYDEIA